mmetsp:Transcript_74045/g.187264  ORF Transcript_74045/g.187264 Transcript_74045/m.187264 type:complete len:257 (-) Transcript_74045:890-1660(-)
MVHDADRSCAQISPALAPPRHCSAVPQPDHERTVSEPVDALEVLHGLHQAVRHAYLACAERHAGVVVLLVGLLRPLGVADLGLEVVHVLLLVLVHAVPEGPLRVRVDVHLDDAGLDGILDVLDRGAGASVEHKGHGLVTLAAQLLFDVLLRVVQDHWLELHVAGRIHSMNVAESGSNGKVAVGYGRQRLVHLPNLLRLGVQAAGIHVRVVNAILLTTRDAKLHLQEQVHLCHALEVLFADGDVLLQRLLRQVKHVR